MKQTITKSMAFVVMFALVCVLATPAAVQAKKAPKLNRTKLTLTITDKKTKPVCKLKVKSVSGKIKWKSANKKIATVSKSGKVTAKKKGRTVITAKIGRKTLRCKITVKDTRKIKVPAKTASAKPNPAPTNTEKPTASPTPTITPTSTASPTPIVTPTPTASPTPKCNHTYESHMAVFEEYYESGPAGSWTVCCHCGLFYDETAARKHLMLTNINHNFEVGSEGDEVDEIGLHGKGSHLYISTKAINGKLYDILRIEYIDKKICTKCGHVLQIEWDTPEQMKHDNSEGRKTPVDPPEILDDSK